jgi:ACS family tartrate transporter-like MFS transporter
VSLAVDSAPSVTVPRVQTALERETMRRVTMRIVPLVFALYVVGFLDRVNIAIASLRMNEDIGLSAAAYGLGSGIFFLGYALFEVPSNILLARVGARWWLARIAVTWGILACAMALVTGPKTFFVLRLLLGFAEAGFFPGVIYYFTQWFPDHRRARATSVFTIGIPVSSLIGGPLGAALLGLDGIAGLAGWQWLFLIEGFPSVLLGIAVLLWLPDRPSTATWLSTAQREWLEGEIARGDASRPTGHESAWSAMSNRTVWWLCAPYVVYILCGYAVVLWSPLVIRSLLEISDRQVGLITGATGLFGVVAMLSSAAVSDRRNERIVHGAFALVSMAVGLSLVAAAPHPVIAVFGLMLAACSGNAYLPVFWCLPPRFLRGVGAAAGIALINSIGNIGGFLGPNVVGSLSAMTGGFSGAFAVMSVMAFMAAIAMLSLRRSSVLAARRLVPNEGHVA